MKLLKRKFTQTLQSYSSVMFDCLPKEVNPGTCEIRIEKGQEKDMIDFNRKKGFICDMDGVLYHGNRVLPGAVEFIDWLHRENKEYLFLTNNSGYTPKELRQKLARMGLEVSEEHFYTSALATAAFLKEQAPGCSVYAIGEAGLLNALYDAGITMNDVNPDYVIMGEGKSYSLDTLTRATNLVRKGAKLIGANSDISGPIEDGIAPACRALVAPIELATGKQAYFCGKPNPLMMRTGLNILGCHSGEAVMVEVPAGRRGPSQSRLKP